MSNLLYLVYSRSETWNYGTPDPDEQHESLLGVCKDETQAYILATKEFMEILYTSMDERKVDSERQVEILKGLMCLSLKAQFKAIGERCVDVQSEENTTCIVIDKCEFDAETGEVKTCERIEE